MKQKKLIIQILMIATLASMSHLSMALQLSPSYQTFTLSEGESATGQFTVTNTEGEDIKVTVGSKDWFVVPGNESFKAKDWLTSEDKEFLIEKGVTGSVPFKVTAPKGAKGELIGMFSFQFKSGGASDLNKVMSSAVYLAIKGTEELKGELSAFSVSPSTSDLEVAVALKNTGNVHIRVAGTFQLIDAKTNQIVSNIILSPGRPTYPGREGVYMGKVAGYMLPAGNYVALIQLKDVDRAKEIVSERKSFTLKKDRKIELKK